MTPGFAALVPMKHLSERVPGKNLRALQGRPLYHWIFETLRASKYVREIVVNTDSPEIARDAADRFGARILWRPDHLLGHMVGIKPLIEYDLSQSEGEYFLQTHSTNPLLTTGTVDRAVEAFLAPGDHDSLFTVTQTQSRFYFADGRPMNHDPGNLVRTQDLSPVYEENSCLYLFTRAGFLRHGHRIGGRPIMFPMSAEEAIDIDEPIDFTVADTLMKARLDNRDSN